MFHYFCNFSIIQNYSKITILFKLKMINIEISSLTDPLLQSIRLSFSPTPIHQTIGHQESFP